MRVVVFASFIVVAASLDEDAPPPPSEGQCANALFRGFRDAHRLNEEIERVAWQVRWNTSTPEQGHWYLGKDGKVECDIITRTLDYFKMKFDSMGCSWGYPTTVFQTRVLSLVQTILEGSCFAYRPWSNDEMAKEIVAGWSSVKCSPEEELMGALRKLIRCAVTNLKEMGANLRDPQLWDIVQAVGQCDQGLVDSCHDDNGEASAAVRTGLAAVNAFFVQWALTAVPDVEDKFRALREQEPVGDPLSSFNLLREIDIYYEGLSFSEVIYPEYIEFLNSNYPQRAVIRRDVFGEMENQILQIFNEAKDSLVNDVA